MMQPLPIEKCSPKCPSCGTDLTFQPNECICKNPACGWNCSECKNEDDI